MEKKIIIYVTNHCKSINNITMKLQLAIKKQKTCMQIYLCLFIFEGIGNITNLSIQNSSIYIYIDANISQLVNY